MSSIHERARGRWPEILEHLKVASKVLDGKHHSCPGCGGVDRFRYKGDDMGGFFCGDRRANGIELVMHIMSVDFAEACRLVEEVVGKDDSPIERAGPTTAEKLRKRAKKLKASKYLAGRGLTVPPGLECVRALEYYDDKELVGKFDAILAPVTLNGQFRTYHATYLQDGQKADVKQPRKVLPGKTIKGGAVELWPCDGDTLGVAEGVETAIAAYLWREDRIPVWAALSTSGMRTLEWPQSVKRLVIYLDHDKNLAGHAAGYHLANRARLRGVQVDIISPDRPTSDMNDVTLGRTKASVVYRSK